MSAAAGVLEAALTLGRMVTDGVGGALLRATVEGSLGVVAVGMLLRALPRLPAQARVALWWLVAAKLLLALAPHVPLAVAPAGSAITRPLAWSAARLGGSSLVARGDAIVTSSGLGSGRGARRDLDALSVAAFSGLRSLVPATRDMAFPPARRALLHACGAFLLLIWATGVCAAVARLLAERWRLGTIWNEAGALESAALRVETSQLLPHRSWLAVPEVRVSRAIMVPMTMGWRRPRVLLPASTCLAGGEHARLALAHELVHVRRHDLLLGWVPALAHVLFWFNPLVTWAGREYVQTREEACDADALRLTGAAPRTYGELLLRYGVSEVLPSAAVASCGSRSHHALTRRLLMLGQFTRQGPVVRMLTAGLLVVACVGLLPVTVVARADAGRVARSARRAEAAAPSAAVTADPAQTPDPVEVPQRATMRHGSGEPVVLFDSDHFGYLFVNKGSRATMGMLNMRDLEVLKRVRKQYDADLLLVRLGRQSYVIQDAALRERAAGYLRPLDDFDADREPMEKRMRELDQRNTELAELVNQAESLTAALEERIALLTGSIEEKHARGSSVSEARRELAALEAKRDLARKNARQAELLNERLEPLRRQAEEKVEAFEAQSQGLQQVAAKQIEAMAREALARGLAVPVR